MSVFADVSFIAAYCAPYYETILGIN